MSNENFERNPVIGGRRIQGGNPADQQTLVFDAATNMWTFGSSVAQLNELEFLQSKDAAGKLRNLTGTSSLAGPVDLITITPPIGTTIVCSSCDVSTRGASAFEFVVIINSVEIAKVTRQPVAGGEMGADTMTTIKGKQLIGDGVKTIIVREQNSGAGSIKVASLEAYDL